MTGFEAFAALHAPGAPLILFNAWDAGSARAIAAAGAKAIATGSWSVAAAHGVSDAEALPLDLALANAREIVRAVDLPVSIDFEGGYAVDPAVVAANMAALAATGAIGCNFEDQLIGGEGIHAVELQSARIDAARRAVGPDFFINARTDIFLQAPAESHDNALLDEAVARADAYAAAGASGFFAPGLRDAALIARLCAATRLPINIMAFAGTPATAILADAGIARVSYGPAPYRAAMAALSNAAQAAFEWA